MRASSGNRDLQDLFQEFLGGVAKFLVTVGGLAVAISIGLLVFSSMQVSSSPQLAADALRNANILKQILMVGTIAVAIGSSFLFWGEEILGAVQLILAGAMFFAPLYLDGMLGNGGEVKSVALGAIQQAGSILGAVGLVVLVVDLAIRARERIKVGTKADQLKYGKQIKQEDDRQNVFMGKCWQLPFCRKFVREKCPIYHAKVTCWRERVGCMCEEQVIRNAMEGRPIPKDQVLAMQYIPRNNKLTEDQKKERCRQCVIYNEHQRHKYKLMLPSMVLGYIAIYALLREPLLQGTMVVVNNINRLVQAGTLGAVDTASQQPSGFMEFLLVCVFLIALSYSLKVLEFLVFRVKL